jgi:hypothetical protein
MSSPNPAPDPQPLVTYLRELRWALAALPEVDRDEIVAEARSHLLDRVDAGSTLATALAALGSAREYAAPFVESYRQSAALSQGRARDLLPVLAEKVASSARAAWTALLLLLIWVAALGIAGTAILKLSHPEIAGLWVGPGHFVFGTIDDPSRSRELLGAWIFPLAGVGLVLAWLATRRLTSAAVRRFGPTP